MTPFQKISIAIPALLICIALASLSVWRAANMAWFWRRLHNPKHPQHEMALLEISQSTTKIAETYSYKTYRMYTLTYLAIFVGALYFLFTYFSLISALYGLLPTS